ncbi:sideroflexin-5 [Magnaporthiopsis poae ATCC 64411]|uniref:Sideroflexin-5 n=1 Tax=Magnaporthiopsis poae (strain ATCC 64411 / 73-15) TaxID=644358 RepID=A0A0C4DTS8_MAGP6|nr:sideroflexin-5 [Magnaporthiopsis poae ATCC 64411]
MSASLPGNRELPDSQYDLSTYWGRVRHAAGLTDPRTLFVSRSGLEQAKQAVISYKQGHAKQMTPELWQAKKIIDSTLHPDTGEPVFLPFRMSCFVLSNLVVTVGMLTPGLSNTGTVLWQIANQSLNVAINSANANKSSPLTYTKMAQSYFLAVGASCSVAVGLNSLVPRLRSLKPSTRMILGRLVPFAAVASAGALNVFLMRGEEMRRGIDVFPVLSEADKQRMAAQGRAESDVQSLGKSKVAARLGRRGDGAVARAQQLAHHGAPAPDPGPAPEDGLASPQPAPDDARQPRPHHGHELRGPAARPGRVSAEAAHCGREARGGVSRPGRRGWHGCVHEGALMRKKKLDLHLWLTFWVYFFDFRGR